MTVYQLVCEGACNPNVAVLDGYILQERQRSPAGVPIAPALWLLDGLRQLRHTPHLMTDEMTAVCRTCGHARQFGGRPMFVPTF